MESADFNANVCRIESLVHDLDSLKDPGARAAALELIRAIMDVHAAGLARILDITAQAGEPGACVADAIARDDISAALLLLHGLHPTPMEQRVAQALQKLEPYLRRRSATAHLLSIDEGVVRIRVAGGPPHSGVSLREAVQDAVYSLAPEVDEVIVDCAIESTDGFVPLSALVAG